MEAKINIKTNEVELITYIGGDAYAAPIVLKSDGVAQNYLYLHRDYQGSILAITDATGTVVEKRLFDAWGEVIKVQDGAGNTLAGLTILDRGYTGHEHLQSIGIIHMNGRLYDPKLHRFLQPDNYVQDPFNTQNFNRYGYCWNNPLKYTDPSGEWIHLLIGAVVGGVINWAVNGCQFNAAGLGYFGTGAASGFVTALTGNPYLGAALLGVGNSVTTQLSTTGEVNFGQVTTSVCMSVAIAGIGAGISNAISPYMDKAVGQLVTNSILKESLTQSLTNSVGGFVIGAGVAGANGSSFNDAISSGWSSAKMGFAMGAISGVIKGYIDVKAKTVSSKDNATQTQAKPTTQKNTVAKYQPENGGAMGEWKTEMTTTGQMMDRYGDRFGTYTSPEGTPFEMRSLPNSTNRSEYLKFEVLKPFPVQKSFVAPAHYNPGGGVQYKLPINPMQLEFHGFIKFHN
jgi:RHS repeat-associated protein